MRTRAAAPPCKTFSGAIAKTAPVGEIDVLDPGGFGALTITKSIAIDGGGTFASVLVAGTNGIVIQAGANDDVTIRNLSINGIGSGINGIRILSARSVRLDNVHIFGFTQRGIDIQSTTAVKVALNNCIIRNNTGIGVAVAQGSLPGQTSVQLTNTVIEGNGSHGMWVTNGHHASIDHSRISHNGLAGLIADGTSTKVTIDFSNLSLNLNGVQAGNGSASSAVIGLSNNTICDKTIGVSVNGGFVETHNNKAIRRNTSGDVSGSMTPVGVQ